MSPTPIETVTAFFKCWSDGGIDGLCRSLHDHFTPETLEVVNGSIVAWRDYFDTLPIAGQGGSGAQTTP